MNKEFVTFFRTLILNASGTLKPMSRNESDREDLMAGGTKRGQVPFFFQVFFVLRGRPRGRMVDFNPSWHAVLRTQFSLP